MEAMLGAMATIIGALIAAIILMWNGSRVQRKNNHGNPGNPGFHCEAMAAADKVKLAISEGLKPLIAIEARLGERPCLGEQMRDALVETLRRRGEG